MAKATKAANQTRAQKAKELHEKKNEVRKRDAQAIKALYREAKDTPLIEDLIAKCKQFIAYHSKIAQDGVGARETGYKLEDGTKEVQNYFLSNDEIAGEMKKASGIQELLDYIERQIADPQPSAKKSAKKK